eukprot:c14729_g1_i1 orf=612-917(+)
MDQNEQNINRFAEELAIQDLQIPHDISNLHISFSKYNRNPNQRCLSSFDAYGLALLSPTMDGASSSPPQNKEMEIHFSDFGKMMFKFISPFHKMLPPSSSS